ncbi:MAG: TRAM domain-containing protein [Deltaproteobacteria bacterium]|nr:TRAM domain-containing protein [Deltaproteobacteria bacterium]
MLYAFPRPLPERFWEVWEASDKILPYLDMPLQHASPTLLARMRRPTNLELVTKQLATFRARIADGHPHAAFRSTFITGHPGETAEDHQALLRFLEEQRFERVGIFAYSDEEDTPAFELPDKVPEALAEERRAEAMILQQRISREQQESLVGQTLEVLVEGVSDESDLLLQGRHRGQAPEIDGLTYINRGEAAPGDLVQVEISQAGDYDLVGGIPGDWGYRPEGSLPIVQG